MVETLKQPQYSPLLVQEQVMVIYTAAKGYLVDIPVEKVVEFQTDFLKFMRTQHPEVAQKIIEQKKFDDALETELKNAIMEFKETVPYKMA